MDTVFNFNSRWGEKGFDEDFFFFFLVSPMLS